MKVNGGNVYVFLERVPLRTHQLLREELSRRGRRTLYISKNSPEVLRSQLNFDESVLTTKWLSTRIDDRTIPPMNLGDLERTIREFLAESDGGIVVLNGLDVLETWNGFYPVIEVLRRTETLVESSSANLIITLDPKNHHQSSLNRLKSISDRFIHSGS